MPSMRRTCLVLLALGAAAPSIAVADDSPPLIMPEVDNDHRVGLSFEIGSLDRGADDVLMLGFVGEGHFRLAPRWGIDLALPMVHTSSDLPSGTGLGNLLLGVGYLLSREGGGSALRTSQFRAAVSLPTASDDGNGLAAAVAGSLFNLEDPGLWAPDTTTLRFMGDYRYQTSPIFLQLEAGVHLLLRDGDDDTLLRVGLGFGVEVSRSLSLLAELQTVTPIVTDDGEDLFLHELDLGMHLPLGRAGALTPRVFFALDDARDYWGVGLDYTAYL